MCIKCVLAADFGQFFGGFNVPKITSNQPFFRIIARFLFSINYAVIILLIALLYEKPLEFLMFSRGVCIKCVSFFSFYKVSKGL